MPTRNADKSGKPVKIKLSPKIPFGAHQQAVGDALSDLLIVEVILAHKKV